MEALSWLAVIVAGVLCSLFLWWSFSLEEIGARSLKWAFLLGTASLMLFLLFFTLDYLSLLPQRAGRMTDEVVLGKKVWHKYLCIDCHTLLGNGAYYAPDLTKSWDRFLVRSGGDEEQAGQMMRSFLKDPPAATCNRRGMPRLGMTDEESRELVSFLRWVASIDTNEWPPNPLYQAVTITSVPHPQDALLYFQRPL